MVSLLITEVFDELFEVLEGPGPLKSVPANWRHW
jgi:hypothetical protein